MFRLRAFETGLNPGTTGGRTDRNRAERTLGDIDVLTTATEGSIVPVQIRLFGGVAAATDDGEPVDVGPAKCQAVLAVLALSPGSAVPVARIVRLVWGDRPPRTAD